MLSWEKWERWEGRGEREKKKKKRGEKREGGGYLMKGNDGEERGEENW